MFMQLLNGVLVAMAVLASAAIAAFCVIELAFDVS